MSLEEDKQKLRAAIKLAASLFEDLPQTDFAICAVSRSEDLQQTTAAVLASNMAWRDDKAEGRLRPASIGMYTDLVVEAKMTTGCESFEEGNWRDKRSKDNSQPPEQPERVQ